MNRDRVQALLDRFHRVAPRDRLAIGAMALAVVVGAEALWVWPLREQRLAIARAGAQQQQADEAQAQLQREQVEQQARELRERRTRLQADLAALGLGAVRHEPLAALLERTLAGQPARLLELRTLPAQALEAAGEPAGAPPAAEGASAVPLPVVYRHRVEVHLAGAPGDVTAAVQALEAGVRPLRLERVILQGRGDGSVVAVVHLLTLGSEPTWLRL